MTHRVLLAVAALACLSVLAGCKESNLRDGPVVGALADAQPFDACPGFEVSELLGRLFINEVMIFNATTFPDEEGFFSAYVELYNASNEAIDLGGVTFSDDLTDTSKWEIPCGDGTVIGPGEYFMIFLDGSVDPTDPQHASFVPPDTGIVTFVLNGGSDLLDVDIDALGIDVAFGRVPDGGEFAGELLQPSPAAENCPSLPCSVEVPQLQFVRGDVDTNEFVDDFDLTALIAYVVDGIGDPPCFDALDVNDDGAVDLVDVNRLALALAGESTIPPPFPDPGTDPTDDAITCEITLP